MKRSIAFVPLVPIIVLVLVAACASPPGETDRTAGRRAGTDAAQVDSGRIEPDAVVFVGTYRARVPVTSTPQRNIRLDLREDGSARLQTDYLNDRQAIIEHGGWEVVSIEEAVSDGGTTEPTASLESLESLIEVVLLGRTGTPYETPKKVTFAPDSHGNELTAVGYDPLLFGPEAPVFRRID